MIRGSRFVVLLVVLVGCGEGKPVVPINTMLWRIEGQWQAPPPGARQDVRTARGTIIGFRSSNEYVEVHCALIEQPDQSVLIQSNRPCVSAVGKWEQRDGEISVTREQASARALCAQPQLEFQITGNSVTGDVVGSGEGLYSPVTRFVAPEFETHVNAARRSDILCTPAPQ